MIGIYRILNKTNNKSYIGSSKNIEGRWKKHRKLLRLGIHWNKHLQNAWNKDKEENFDFIVIEETNNLLEREQCYINTEGHYNKENPTSNGTRGMHLTDEHKKKVSLALKGRKQSQEHIKHVVEALKGKKKSEETKEKIRQTLLGRKLSEEHKKHISEGEKGKIGYWTGKTFSKEHKLKISKGGKGVKHAKHKRKTNITSTGGK